MSFLEKILLPVDFSDRCYGATRFVEALADPERSEIYLLHVKTPLTYELSAVDVGGTILREVQPEGGVDERQQLEAFLKDELAKFRVQRILLEGDPARRIVDFAHKNHIDLITMPTHGYGLFRRFLLGSVTAKVLHDADCPVWTGVHLEEAPEVSAIHFRNVLAAVDLCPTPSMRTMDWAARLAARFGATLKIAHAYPSLEGHAGEYFDPGWRDYFHDTAAEEIAKMQEKTGIRADVVIEGGDVPRAVCSIAEREHADVLVIGRGSAAGVFGRLHANAYSIIRQSPCPVVSV